MKLISLQLNNFRQFYGKSPVIEFSRTKLKNVTMIHAENGAGKTALLNAFIWVLYEKHTAGFLYPEKLVNFQAIAEAKPDTTINAWVELKFEHEEIRYTLKRVTAVYKKSAQEWNNIEDVNAELFYKQKDGKIQQAGNVKDIIGRILPEDLYYYFFFDGERIEKIVNPDIKARKELGDATQKLLGLMAFERAILHLNSARKSFEVELKAIGDPETQNLLEQKERLENETSEWNRSLEESEANLDSHNIRKTEIENRLRDIQAVQELQKRRDVLEDELEDLIVKRRNNRHNLQMAISKQSYFVFLDQHITQFKNIIEEKEAKGDLPSKYKKQFILDLIEMQECICGRSLAENENQTACEKVKAWLDKAGLDGVDEMIYTLRANLDEVPEKLNTFWETLRTYQDNVESFGQEEGKIENELEEINQAMRSCTQEDVADLEVQLDRTKEAITATIEKIGGIKIQIKKAEQQTRELEKELSIHESKEEKQELIRRRINAASEARDRFQLAYDHFKIQLRDRLQVKVNKIFHRISVTDYKAQLDEDFSLSLINQSSLVPQSQGESQILSLSFIAGIVELVREGLKDEYQKIVSRDSQYPIVMDSPFGTLDMTNRRRVTEQINTIADQVIMLVSSSQWKDEVKQVSEKNLGRSYVLKYHTPKEDFKEDISITLFQRRYELVVKSIDGFEHTEIIEVKDE